MNRYYVTFGQRYKEGPHPKVKYAHPDGWLTVCADDAIQARAKTFEELGDKWAFMYLEKDFHSEYFPLGELHKI